MRGLSSLGFCAFVLAGASCASPIAYFSTEAVEEMRAQGLSESVISAQLSPIHATPAYIDAFAPVRSARDTSGDISPGSLPVPQMLPHSTTRSGVLDFLRDYVDGVMFWRGSSGYRHGLDTADAAVTSAYEGREEEVRRPTGMRFWGH